MALTEREKQLANYLVDKNKEDLNRISKDCISPFISIRKSVKKTAQAIGKTELQSQEPITNKEWVNITLWIYNTFFDGNIILYYNTDKNEKRYAHFKNDKWGIFTGARGGNFKEYKRESSMDAAMQKIGYKRA